MQVSTPLSQSLSHFHPTSTEKRVNEARVGQRTGGCLNPTRSLTPSQSNGSRSSLLPKNRGFDSKPDEGRRYHRNIILIIIIIIKPYGFPTVFLASSCSQNFAPIKPPSPHTRSRRRACRSQLDATNKTCVP
ncbi:hypothetical protein BDV24DRAFT_124571 [Aspergillus arachidicola]|uniref:Uncharacterized protein n=1 Tax=Aspergillus arachidicola TaxID=656916 RepID=A0A5N6YMI5_9EURO|nr:hypothetical protein BDV24DRAFT_124571 [Aspergillus arachidicola]